MFKHQLFKPLRFKFLLFDAAVNSVQVDRRGGVAERFYGAPRGTQAFDDLRMPSADNVLGLPEVRQRQHLGVHGAHKRA